MSARPTKLTEWNVVDFCWIYVWMLAFKLELKAGNRFWVRKTKTSVTEFCWWIRRQNEVRYLHVNFFPILIISCEPVKMVGRMLVGVENKKLKKWIIPTFSGPKSENIFSIFF